MNGYKVFYNGKSIEVYAETTYKAQQEAARILKAPPKKQHMITVILCERADGSQVIHSTSEIG